MVNAVVRTLRFQWLPVHCHVLFEYNLLTFKALNYSQPAFLAYTIKASPLAHGKRLVSSQSRKKCKGCHRFFTADPRERNILP